MAQKLKATEDSEKSIKQAALQAKREEILGIRAQLVNEIAQAQRNINACEGALELIGQLEAELQDANPTDDGAAQDAPVAV